MSLVKVSVAAKQEIGPLYTAALVYVFESLQNCIRKFNVSYATLVLSISISA